MVILVPPEPPAVRTNFPDLSVMITGDIELSGRLPDLESKKRLSFGTTLCLQAIDSLRSIFDSVPGAMKF